MGFLDPGVVMCSDRKRANKTDPGWLNVCEIPEENGSVLHINILLKVDG